ncbi:MAG: BrnT family toxin [Deltaproteobacteria bacterium]|nr:BrnT family toxin [Deltaproteobacteria bacterium]
MNFEWDESKSNTNKSKHGIDFETAKNIFLDENRVEIMASYPIENRFINIGKLKGKLWTVIFTIRGDAIRIISVRRSRKKEVKLYEEKYFS